MVTEDMKKTFAERRAKTAAYMTDHDIAAAVFEDNEDHREPAVKYLTGYTSDALLIFFADNRAVLIPWDENLAKQLAHAETIIASSNFGRQSIKAVKEILSAEHTKKTVELPPSTSYPAFLSFVDALPDWDVRCRENSLHDYVASLRAVKDAQEIASVKAAAAVGDHIIDVIEAKLKEGQLHSETDVALLIEKECRENGCERTGFDTLAAGSARSFAIHCFPSYTAGPWADDGLSILDFGVVRDGYTSDTTITVARGALSAEQEKLVSLVQKAYDTCLTLYKKDIPVQKAALKAQEIFAKARRKMPHALGHGIGLEIHESPVVRTSVPPATVFKPGMIITLEPGLYDAHAGGCRLENDVLITEDGNEVLSHARIIRL